MHKQSSLRRRGLQIHGCRGHNGISASSPAAKGILDI